MNESEFLKLAEVALSQIEDALDDASAGKGIDIECARSGNVLEIEFVNNGTKIIINSQVAMQEIWVAAKSGGFHFRWRKGKWVDTRDGGELFSALSEMVSMQAECAVTLTGI